MKILILDYYVDEPACFGVPPYISPYIRYIAGALVTAGIAETAIDYLTIDELRRNNFNLKEEYPFVFLVMGSTVPGKYLGGKIGSVTDLIKFLEYINSRHKKTSVIIGGPIQFANDDVKKEINSKRGILVKGDIEALASKIKEFHLLQLTEEFSVKLKRNHLDLDNWSLRGAFITTQHPNFPNLINEIETYRGCTRDVYCSFCTEAFYGRPNFRTSESVIAEFAELYKTGNRYFRLGRQADLLTYLPYMKEYKNSFPRPNPESLYTLYSGINKVAPDLKLLHLDNINPGVIATFPEESAQIIEIITEFNTSGDTAAMGLESVDEAVIQLNDLKCSPEEALTAIRIVNHKSYKDNNGIPKLLPGLNFISGLDGEDENTFKKNYLFLKQILDEGLMLRRINIRQVIKYNKTKLFRTGFNRTSKTENRFIYYRDKIREEIDEPMLARVYPAGMILENVIIESFNSGYYLGRQLGSYPITVKITGCNEQLKIHEKIDVLITNHNERSITGIFYPIKINRMNQNGFKTINGVGKKMSSAIKYFGPYKSADEIKQKIPDFFKVIHANHWEIDFS